jgi:hypothetical protein
MEAGEKVMLKAVLPPVLVPRKKKERTKKPLKSMVISYKNVKYSSKNDISTIKLLPHIL